MTVSSFSAIPIGVDQDAADLTAAMHQAVERRAYDRFETRNRQDSDDLADWLAAEQEVLLGDALSVSELTDHIDIQLDLGNVIPGTVRLAVEPRQIILTGAYDRTFQCGAEPDSCSELHPHARFRRISLPSEVDPEHTTASLEKSAITVTLGKAESKHRQMAA